MGNTKTNNNFPVKNSPWLSIVIPIYNAEKYLRECLNSIYSQTYTDYEVLLIDDGSSDTSPDICQEFSKKDLRFRYIRKENGGSYQSRLYGIERATGTYITFCDADDFYSTKKAFSILHKEIVENNCTALQFGFVKKYNHLRHNYNLVKSPINYGKAEFQNLEFPIFLCSFWETSHMTTNVWNKVYHKSLFANIPSSDTTEKIFWGDDLILNLHILSTCESFRLIPTILYCYRELSGNTNKFSMQTMKDLDNIKKYQLLFLTDFQGEEKEKIQKNLFSEIAGWFFVYIQQALEFLSKEQLIEFINEILQYPHFILAKKYFENRPGENWTSVNLLRNGNANEYIAKAIECQKKQTLKSVIRNFLKKIYISL